jgi:hypothetical protein
MAKRPPKSIEAVARLSLRDLCGTLSRARKPAVEFMMELRLAPGRSTDLTLIPQHVALMDCGAAGLESGETPGNKALMLQALVQALMDATQRYMGELKALGPSVDSTGQN